MVCSRGFRLFIPMIVVALLATFAPAAVADVTSGDYVAPAISLDVTLTGQSRVSYPVFGSVEGIAPGTATGQVGGFKAPDDGSILETGNLAVRGKALTGPSGFSEAGASLDDGKVL